ncbi:MAG: hypothetical protein WDN24_09240 [Sphingomonas sp.]
MDVRNDRIAGGALVLAALISMLAMAHHPSSAHALVLGRTVHGVMIAAVGVTVYGFAHLAIRRGIGDPAVLAGLVAYAIAAAANIGAATINGFVVTALVERGPLNPGIARLAWEANQALARLAVVAGGIAFLLWSLGFVRRRGLARPLGLLGIAAGLVPVAMLALGLRMNVAGAMLVYGIQSAWIALAGLYLWSGRFAKELG